MRLYELITNIRPFLIETTEETSFISEISPKIHNALMTRIRDESKKPNFNPNTFSAHVGKVKDFTDETFEDNELMNAFLDTDIRIKPPGEFPQNSDAHASRRASEFNGSILYHAPRPDLLSGIVHELTHNLDELKSNGKAFGHRHKLNNKGGPINDSPFNTTLDLLSKVKDKVTDEIKQGNIDPNDKDSEINIGQIKDFVPNFNYGKIIDNKNAIHMPSMNILLSNKPGVDEYVKVSGNVIGDIVNYKSVIKFPLDDLLNTSHKKMAQDIMNVMWQQETGDTDDPFPYAGFNSDESGRLVKKRINRRIRRAGFDKNDPFNKHEVYNYDYYTSSHELNARIAEAIHQLDTRVSFYIGHGWGYKVFYGELRDVIKKCIASHSIIEYLPGKTTKEKKSSPEYKRVVNRLYDYATSDKFQKEFDDRFMERYIRDISKIKDEIRDGAKKYKDEDTSFSVKYNTDRSIRNLNWYYTDAMKKHARKELLKYATELNQELGNRPIDWNS